MIQAAKKQRTHGQTALYGSNVPIQQINKILQNLEQAPITGKLLKDKLHLDIHTPVGSLLQTLELDTIDGGSYTFQHVNPCALLFILCDRSRRFAKLLTGLMMPLTLLLSTDATTPGNQLHPDQPRQSDCIWFSFTQLPDWFRTRTHKGWWPFGFVKHTVIPKLVGGYSALMKRVLEVFFCSLFNLLHGINIPDGTGNRARVTAHNFTFIQDEKAQKETFDLKGAGGASFCKDCANVWRHPNKKQFRNHDYLVHVADATYNQCDMHTGATYQEACARLAHVAQTAPPLPCRLYLISWASITMNMG